MISKTITNRMKAAAIAALMCLSVATAVPAMTTPMTVDAVSIGQTLKVKGVYRGTTVEIGNNLDAITFTCVADYTGNFSYGFGIGITKDPYWKEWDGTAKKWVAEAEGTSVAVTAGEEFTITIDTSSLDLKYDPASAQYPGEYEFRNYYSGTGGTVKIVSAVSGKGSSPSTPSKPDTPSKPSGPNGSESKNPTSGTWSFVDNKDGTGTMTATQARQLDGLEYLLTKGYDEDYYAAEGITPGEDDPINSHKFAYSDFGLGPVGSAKIDTGITVESLQATITSDAPFKRFMYGGGLNVQNESPADTESAKVAAGYKEEGGYWYNDMGEDVYEECLAAGVEFGVDINMGYDMTSEDMQLGEYFDVIWDVPEGVKPYEDSGSISFQFWYGEEDTEEYTEIETCNLIGAVLTYTEEKTFDFTDIASIDVNEEIAAGEMSSEIAYADMELGENADVKAVVFHVDVASDLDKLVYAVGTSVGDAWGMWADAENGDEWNYVLTDVASGTADIVWIVPDGADVNEMYGNAQLGYWYGGKEGKELDSITLESVDVYYAEEEVPTETTTTATTKATTTTTKETTTTTKATTTTTKESTTTTATKDDEPEEVTLYGDVNVDGKVNVLDVIMLNKNLLGGEEISKIGALNADVDRDGTPSVADSLNILKYMISLVEKLPVA